ncbi:MAG: hypothetical protein LBE12_01790, partial [Planctomycetaceae bacterium]|jgi:regulator of replication initiation timing|nr:hypothetical protein [Planctomycetaceae bacterium]
LSILFNTQLEIGRQSILAFVHTVALPNELWNTWNQLIGEDLSVPQNGIRIYYPNVSSEDAKVCHPNWTEEEINSWQWANHRGISAFAIYMKDRLSKYAAEKPMDWGNCLFYPKMRERLSELRREQFAKSQFESDYIVTLEEDNAAQKKTIDELELENNTLKEERFQLTQKLQYQYCPNKETDTTCSPVKVKIRRKAKEDLEKIYGDAGNTLRTMVQSCENKDWRGQHFDSWNKTDLTVLKSAGKSMTRLAGYEQDGVFYIAFVFDDHNNYEHTLENKHHQKKHVHHSIEEYVDV